MKTYIETEKSEGSHRNYRMIFRSFKSEKKGNLVKLQCRENCENITTSCPDNEAPHFDSDDIIKR